MYPLRMRTKMKSSFETLRESLWKKHDSQTIKQFEDTSVRNVLIKAVCLTSASLAANSNVIKELQKFRELQNTIITIN